MKISTKGRYGLTIMIQLAKNSGGNPLTIKSIAEKGNLSGPYLEQIIALLRNAGLVKSIRGAKGGYVLVRNPKEITAAEIIRVLEGPITPVEGIDNEEPAQQSLWIRVRDAVKNVLDSTTLEDLTNSEDVEEQELFMYYI
ncbi:Rrf2 family transcriptional regulator [Peribacillus saganii]|uniref:Rrf2 family transcriptional regulator n=1 Tax=Peribacillus saganii TaxID=2303992 RepID=A0A372LNP9_9BACI|nr:Rrf2 family transcriptional regulator [Peribacillus saganii]RFU69253.1 Rrf2 family transcriptional regulator [Peribacillus saganii]